MKNLSSAKNNFVEKLSNKTFLGIWLLFHVAVVIFFVSVLLFSKDGVSIDADLMNMFPKSFTEESVRKADEKLTNLTGNNVFVLVYNEDFQQAKACAEKVYERITSSDNFTSISLYSNMDSYAGLTDLLFDYRWNLLDDKSIDLINSEGGAEAFAQNALMQAYSPFTITSLDNLDMDPFMLLETETSSYMNAVQSSGTRISINDGVLATEANGGWYVMLRMILSDKGAALASNDNGVNELYRVCAECGSEGTRFIYSGAAVNSSESSSKAMTEISVISTVSLLIVVIMLIFVFRSPVPILCSVGSIFVSIGVAFIMTLAVFHKVHILCLVFGTSLIGSCIDYSLHYFTHWAGNKDLASTKDIRNHLLPGLSMAIISSSICYLILLFAPFDLLKQMAMFSVTGLISSFLTTLGVYPFIPVPKEEKRHIPMLAIMRPSRDPQRKKLIGRIFQSVLFAFAIISLLICHKNIRIKNDLSKLYTMEGQILEDRNETVDVIKYNPSGWFIIRGDTAEDALLKEERICSQITEKYGEDMGYICTSKFIPTVEKQKRSREACRKLLALAPEQYEALGFEASYADELSLDFELSEGNYISFDNNNVPEAISTYISTAWLGEMEGKYYTVVMPNIITDYDGLKSMSSESDGIFFVHKIADMGSDLDKLTVMVLEFFAGAYILMFIVLKFFYKWKNALKIISVPLLIFLMTGAVFSIAKINLEFFSTTGLILVFGLGLDYIIYMMENEKNKDGHNTTLEPFATLLSFVTTIVSFGALALSNFQPVHLMGLSIFLGLATAYISTMLYDRSL